MCRSLTSRQVIVRLCSGLIAWFAYVTTGFSQSAPALPNVHYLLDSASPPGVVARAQMQRGQPNFGRFAALSVSGPEGLKIGLARDGQFLEPLDAPVTTGMLVGAVYRIRVTNIPFRPGEELYPTIEVIDSINPPAGREHRFPIPIALTEEDLRLALDGALVTRVIYLEDSENASPVADVPGVQTTFDVGPQDNALQTADRFGKPVAILRIGSRVPADLTGDLTEFLYGCPPWLPLVTAPSRQRMIDAGQWPEIEAVEHNEHPYRESIDQDYPRANAY